MSKQLQAVCVLLLAGIFVIQLIGLLSSRRPAALRSNAMIRNIDGESSYNNDYYNGFSGGGSDNGVRVLDEGGNCLPGGC